MKGNVFIKRVEDELKHAEYKVEMAKQDLRRAEYYRDHILSLKADFHKLEEQTNDK